METLLPSSDCIADLGNPKMPGKNVFQFQQVVDDTHVADLVGFRWILVDDFTKVAFIALLVNERSQLSSVMHLAVMLIQVGPFSKLFLTEAATKVRDSLGSVRFGGLMRLTRR